jgi:hypothetical protein
MAHLSFIGRRIRPLTLVDIREQNTVAIIPIRIWDVAWESMRRGWQQGRASKTGGDFDTLLIGAVLNEGLTAERTADMKRAAPLCGAACLGPAVRCGPVAEKDGVFIGLNRSLPGAPKIYYAAAFVFFCGCNEMFWAKGVFPPECRCSR